MQRSSFIIQRVSIKQKTANCASQLCAEKTNDFDIGDETSVITLNTQAQKMLSDVASVAPAKNKNRMTRV